MTCIFVKEDQDAEIYNVFLLPSLSYNTTRNLHLQNRFNIPQIAMARGMCSLSAIFLRLIFFYVKEFLAIKHLFSSSILFDIFS